MSQSLACIAAKTRRWSLTKRSTWSTLPLHTCARGPRSVTVSIQDIVKAADVSYSAVSRVLRRNAANHEKTAWHMRHLATEIACVPCAIASELVTPTTRTSSLAFIVFAAPSAAKVVRWAGQRSPSQGSTLFSPSTPSLRTAGRLGSIRRARESVGWRHRLLRSTNSPGSAKSPGV